MQKPEYNALSPITDVVITGGSSGIGKCFIETIRHAKPSVRVCNLSRTNPSFFTDFDNFRHIPCDLSRQSEVLFAIAEIEGWLSEVQSGQILLINNSGFGSYGEFKDLAIENELQMLDTNLRGLVHLTGSLLPKLLAKKGAIINVASTAAWQPTPFMATYGATKSFLLNWSLALNAELAAKGVRVLALCPGPTESNFFKRAGFTDAPLSGKGQTAQEVVDNTLKALSKKRSLVVSGVTNKIMVSVSSRLPKFLQAPIAKAVLKKMRLDKFKKH